MTGLGPVNTSLVCMSKDMGSTMHLTQEAYIDKVLDRFNMSACSNFHKPLLPGQELSVIDDELVAVVPYKEAIGALLLLSRRTRPCSITPSWEIIFRIRSRMRSATAEPDTLQYPRACPRVLHGPRAHVYRRVRSARPHGYYVYFQRRRLTVLQCRPTCTTVVHYSTSVL